MTKVVWSARIRLAGALILIVLSTSCGQLTRQGTASSYLIVAALQGSSGATPGEFGGTLDSDVLTVVEGTPTIFSDVGRVQFTLGMKDAGSSGTPNSPTQANWITVERYRVAYIRADGRNTPGVDVPYPFDGAVTVTVSGPGVAMEPRVPQNVTLTGGRLPRTSRPHRCAGHLMR